MMKGIVFVISGPAGVGKTTLCDRLLSEFDGTVSRVVTATTRKPRVGETPGDDYYFMSEEEFLRKFDEGAFIEHERVHGNLYGTLKQSILSRAGGRAGNDYLLNIDVNGAFSLKKFSEEHEALRGGVFSVFILPHSLDQLRARLEGRGTDDEDEIERRMATAVAEIEKKDQFDLVLESGEREEDYRRLKEYYLQCSEFNQSEK